MQSQPNPEIRHCRMSLPETTPKLEQNSNSTNSTPPRYKKHFPATTGVEFAESSSPIPTPTVTRTRTTRIIRTTLAMKKQVSDTIVFGCPVTMEAPPLSPHPNATDHFTYFTEIAMKKTRNSYDPSEVPLQSFVSVRPGVEGLPPTPTDENG